MSIASILGYTDRVFRGSETYVTEGNWCACMGPQNGEPLCPCKMRQMKPDQPTNKSGTENLAK